MQTFQFHMKNSTFNIQNLRSDFPLLNDKVAGKKLAYLDNAASTQKPKVMIDQMNQFYLHQYSNVHRGIYTLSEEATALFEQTREKIQYFIHAQQLEEIVFTSGTTQAINLIAHSYLMPLLKPEDEILISHMEHHANIVPWHQLCMRTGAKLRVIPITTAGELDLSNIHKLIHSKTRLIAVTHVSNVLGTVNPVQELIALAHAQGIPVLLDGAQAVTHFPIDVQFLDCDFYTFSSHKMYGPTGIGVLYAKMKYLEKMPPWQGGGGMIERVSFTQVDYRDPPHRFEAGTPAIAEAIGLGATIDYLNGLDWTLVQQHEEQLLDFATQALSTIPNLELIGTAAQKIAVISFIIKDIHSHDIATILNTEGIAVRAGHHCAMPLMEYFNIPATTRISLACYNTQEDIETLINGLHKVRDLFK